MDSIDLALLSHVFAACLMVGATTVNGVLHMVARRLPAAEARPVLAGILAVNRRVMLPGFVALPATGAWLVLLTGYDLWAPWLAAGIGLTALLILAFVVGERIERRLWLCACEAATQGAGALPIAYHKVFRRAAPIGAAALAMGVATLALMIAKPV